MSICPCCHINYEMDNTEMFDHIKNCDGRKDIICPRWYTHKELYKMYYNKDNKKDKIIISTISEKRPSTR